MSPPTAPRSAEDKAIIKPERQLTTCGLLIALGIVGLTILAVELAYVLLLTFAGVLIAMVLRHASEAVAARTPLPVDAAVTAIIVTGISLVTLFFYLGGERIGTELAALANTLRDTVAEFEAALSERAWGRTLLSRVSEGVDPREWNLLGTVTGFASSVVGVFANLLVVGTVAIYMTLNPGSYRRGVLRLFPVAKRERIAEVFAEIGRGMTWWLIGQGVVMLAVAVLVALGLWALRVPLPIALGVIAGVMNFIPYLGPYLGGAPAVLIAFAQEPIKGLYVAILVLIVQQIVGNFITPVVQQRATSSVTLSARPSRCMV